MSRQSPPPTDQWTAAATPSRGEDLIFFLTPVIVLMGLAFATYLIGRGLELWVVGGGLLLIVVVGIATCLLVRRRRRRRRRSAGAGPGPGGSMRASVMRRRQSPPAASPDPAPADTTAEVTPEVIPPVVSPPVVIPPRTVQPEPPPPEDPGGSSPVLVPLVTGSVDQTDGVRLPLPDTVLAAGRDASFFFGGYLAHTGWEVRGASLCGFSHSEDREPGQDAAGVRWSEGRQSLILVVADGLGSRPDSGAVASCAVSLALDLATEDGSVGPGAHLAAVADGLHAFIEREEIKGATTIVLAELSGDNRRGLRLRLAAVGDSEAWILADRTWQVVHHERRGNITEALPHSDRMREADIEVPPGAVVTLATDGFAHALTRRSPLATALVSRWASVPTQLAFANDVAFQDDLYLDDRTVLAVWTGAAA
jgi:hypothetical protein